MRKHILAVPLRGTYCLCIRNNQDQTIKIGALNDIMFKKGKYVYIGSALNSLIPRLERHLKISRGEHNITHWHIDYFLKEGTVEIDSIYTITTNEHLECIIADQLSRQAEIIPRFGCSDCKCSSHLFKVDNFNIIEKYGLKKWI
jgi:Uri superfamily endonuclease